MQTRSLPFHAKAMSRGFSLVEVAVVMMIVLILIAAVSVPITTQVETRRVNDTQKQLESVKDAIYGFAMANGRLPCPASATSGAQESFCTNDLPATCGPELVGAVPVHGRCTAGDGFVPARTLSLMPVDPSGYLQDSWADSSTARRVRYAVSRASVDTTTNVLTRTDGIRTATMSRSAATTMTYLYVCATGLNNAPSATNCGSAPELTRTAPFVVYSLGKDTMATSFDSANNQNADIVFTSGAPTATFDDLLTWGSLNVLYGRMVQAGRLP